MKGYVFITSSGYDPSQGKHVKDPYLGAKPTLGGCMPNIRRLVVPGDHIFVVSGKVKGLQQYLFANFEVEEKINALAAYKKYPDLRLQKREDGQLTGNVIVDARGRQHPLDGHDKLNPAKFERRIENYVVGCNLVALTAPEEVQRGRDESLPILRTVLRREGSSPLKVMGRWSKLDGDQVQELRQWLISLKTGRH